jgi:hypothetical protein
MTEMKASTGNTQSITVVTQGNVNISDVNMLQNINITTDMVAKLNNTYDVNSLVDTTIDTAAQASLDADNTSLMGAQTTLTNTQYNLVTNVKTQLKNMIKKEDIVSCTSNIINSQSISVTTQGDVTIKTINMTITANIIAKCMINTIMSYLDKVQIDDKTIEAVKSDVKATVESPVTDWIFYIMIGLAVIVALIFGIKFLSIFS